MSPDVPLIFHLGSASRKHIFTTPRTFGFLQRPKTPKHRVQTLNAEPMHALIVSNILAARFFYSIAEQYIPIFHSKHPGLHSSLTFLGGLFAEAMKWKAATPNCVLLVQASRHEFRAENVHLY